MKTIERILDVVCASACMLFLGILAWHLLVREADPSWETYCHKYGVSVHSPSSEAVNAYLDGYVGSAEEERDMEELGITE